ncbi:P-loop containing nucleoside triphosphate hydrolase protein [Collybia nuda]|uniref:P-loop containing nucleoside triphosphate hydrolase protein n=1 Tax=Collybia nuda TaxID=64659 RepID=A0A9P5YAN3_9AGAR|nr:P-loop containing nucleoside triphosphate hydrolase protein [Collybia nuda]
MSLRAPYKALRHPGLVFRPSRRFSVLRRDDLQNTVIHIPKADIYRFGDPNFVRPLFRDVEWTVKEGEAWAIVGSGSGEKTSLLQVLLGHLRISPSPPPPGGLFPFLNSPSSGSPRDPLECISIVSFGNRRRAAGGAFYDYTARYGAVREEDRLTLRQSMFPESQPPEFGLNTNTPENSPPPRLSEQEMQVFNYLVDKMGLAALLDLPLIALSNGQTRRARVIKAILSRPELLLLDEPLTGLDLQNRPTLLEILRSLHSARSPRVILGLRTQDPVPEWITHVAFVKDGKVITGPKEEVLSATEHFHKPQPAGAKISPTPVGELVVEMKGVGVKYGNRTVLNNINWEIRQGERWHLQGTNGSGKTTLLSLLTGDHPQSYTQPHLHLHGLPRHRIPTPHLHSLVGLVSPELFDAFPRRAGMSVWEAVGTGFDGGFVPLGTHGVGTGIMAPLDEAGIQWRVRRCQAVIDALGPRSWSNDTRAGESAEAFAKRAFVDLSVGEQRMVLLMRALVGRPPLVLLDEVWSGMDEGMVRAARRYLREGGVGDEQGVVVITHWEDEVPWTEEDGVKRFRLDGGEGRVQTLD